VDDGDEFRVCTGDGIEGRQLSHAKGGDQSADALDTRIAIGGVAYYIESIIGIRNSRV
jgi:hypothetical protein